MFAKSTNQFGKTVFPRPSSYSWSGRNLTAGDFGAFDGQNFGHGMFGGIYHFDNRSSTNFTKHVFPRAQSAGWDGDNLSGNYYGINDLGDGVPYSRGVFEGLRHFNK